MAKIIVTLNGLIQQDVALVKPRLSIGRRHGNDLRLDQLTVSGNHASIDITSTGTFILDLGSTNGTLVNGQPITMHMLQHEDVIAIGKYRIRFVSAEKKSDPVPLVSADAVNNRTINRAINHTINHTINSGVNASESRATQDESPVSGKIRVLNGCNAGRELLLIKPVTTLGTPGGLIVTLTREPQHYVLTQVEGGSSPQINDQALAGKSCQLNDGDVIDLLGTKMAFSLT
jgi:pSer/pThr/pTyr-binding forkhead associated (FHA) protein